MKKFEENWTDYFELSDGGELNINFGDIRFALKAGMPVDILKHIMITEKRYVIKNPSVIIDVIQAIPI